jgi:recombinational DNA repair protein (RecF pathway)
MQFEGIVTHKVPYKERDLIVKLVLRNGTVGSFYIYGGQGGGKKHKPTIFELGSMVKILVRDQKASRIEGSELMVAAETQRIWEPQRIRHNIQAFYLVCLYFEILQKFSMNFQLGSSEYDNNEHEGIFSVISNALFHLDDSITKDVFIGHQQLTLFMIKLLYHLGIMPETENCSQPDRGASGQGVRDKIIAAGATPALPGLIAARSVSASADGSGASAH